MKVALLSNVNVVSSSNALRNLLTLFMCLTATIPAKILSDESDLFKFYPDLYVLLIEEML